MSTRSTLAYALLGLLAGRPMSGYDLTRSFDGSLRYVWSATHSQIYPELAKLVEAGLIEAGETESRNRTPYKITKAGKSELRRWLTETKPKYSPRDEPMLRTFFMWTLPPEQRRAYFEELERHAREQLAEYEAIAEYDSLTTPEDRAYRIALEAGLRTERTLADWSAWAAKQSDDA